ncbi:enoyl-CoA hydratase-related protein [Hyphomonas sp.]|uniref:enoyl-CoA hydratase-related protein n=1 Tax=Hyphomonas sp. TaxID=87 RepID=UPI0025C65268|nr:enoyl-CoA hydratase-related protein [Hyphomonas sp.]
MRDTSTGDPADPAPILQTFSGSVLTITLNRPSALNSLNRALMEYFRDALAVAAADASVRALIITGAGRGFCAGADLVEQTDKPPVSRGQGISDGMTSHFNPLARDLAAFPKPTVAAVNGVAAGGGVGLALACDIVLAARSATFIQVFAPQLGLVPDMGCSWHLPRLVGAARARALALLGDKLPAEKAAEWGLIWQAVDDADLLAQATALAERLAAGPTLGLVRTREVLAAAFDNDFAAQLDLERRTQFELGNTEDFAEGVRAFVQKRRPKFAGH